MEDRDSGVATPPPQGSSRAVVNAWVDQWMKANTRPGKVDGPMPADVWAPTAGDSGLGATSPPAGIHPLLERGLLLREPRPLRENDAKRLQELEEWFAECVAVNEAGTPVEQRAARRRGDRTRAGWERQHPSLDEIERRKRLLAAKLHHDAGRNRDAYFAALLEPSSHCSRPRSLRRQPRRRHSTPRRARAPSRPGREPDTERAGRR